MNVLDQLSDPSLESRLVRFVSQQIKQTALQAAGSRDDRKQQPISEGAETPLLDRKDRD